VGGVACARGRPRGGARWRVDGGLLRACIRTSFSGTHARALLVGSRPDADSDERRAARAKTIGLIREGGAEALWRDTVPKLFADEHNADERLLHRDREDLIAAVEAIRDRADSTDVARILDDRVRFVIGEHDSFVSADELREFDVREIHGAGHLVNLERPEEFSAQLQEFLGGL
jgi:pimeloyl-ACP methyl ester carboxylesterase